MTLDVFIGLEMVEHTEHNVYCVKSFAKHQNIKAKQKTEVINKEVIANDKVQEVDNLKDEVNGNDNNKSENQVNLSYNSIAKLETIYLA